MDGDLKTPPFCTGFPPVCMEMAKDESNTSGIYSCKVDVAKLHFLLLSHDQKPFMFLRIYVASSFLLSFFPFLSFPHLCVFFFTLSSFLPMELWRANFPGKEEILPRKSSSTGERNWQ